MITGVRAALLRGGHLPFNPSLIEILIERCDQEENVYVRSDNLFRSSGAFGFAHESAEARQHGMNDAFVSVFNYPQRHPVAGCWKAGAILGLVLQSPSHFGQYPHFR
jgi:hypothetical protein